MRKIGLKLFVVPRNKRIILGLLAIMLFSTNTKQAYAVRINQNKSSLQEEVEVKGTVTDAATNETIPGVSIQVNGKALATNSNGAFSVMAPIGSKIVFTILGYTVHTHTVTKAESNIKIKLKESSTALNEVVVTALGIKREEKALGYSISTVKGETLQDAMPNNWTDALSGRVAGVNLMKSGGGPAGTNKIVLRGENSLDNQSEALIVLDGVIMSGSSGRQTGSGSGSYLDGDSPVDFGTSIADINPEDIESVSVLKGPGAAALYGSRGANGAIIITTKQGKSAQKGLGIRFNSNSSFAAINRWPDFQYEYGQGESGQDTWYSYNASVDGSSTRSTSSAWGAKFDGQSFFQYDPATNGPGAERTPWVAYPNNRKDFFDVAKTFTNSLTLTGGTEKTQARLSLTNVHNSWIVPNTGYGRNTVALNVDQLVNKDLKISAKINYTNKKSDNLPSTGYNNQTIMYFIRGMVPNANIDWFKDYWLPGLEGIEQRKPFSSLLDNPYLQANEMINASDRNGLVGNISATYNFTKDISLLVRTAMDLSYEARTQQRPYNSQKFREGMYRTQNIFSQEINTDWLFSYNNWLDVSDFKGSLSFGGAQMVNKYNRDELRADRLLLPGIYNFANARDVVVTLPYKTQYNTSSLYALAPFSYRNMYFLDFTFRGDWTSVLSNPETNKNRFIPYYSINGSAVLSEALQLPYAISYLKARLSYSEVGSGSNVPYRLQYLFSTHPSFASGLSNPTQLPNEGLLPLRTKSYEAGLDLKMFNNRFGLDVSVYRNSTFDQIFPVPVDPSSGYYSKILNSGEVRNTGIEIQTDYAILKSKTGFNWKMYGTFAYNDNKIVSLHPDVDTYVMSTGPGSRGTIEARPGQRMGEIYGIGYLRAPDGQIIYNEQGYAKRSEEALYLGNTTARFRPGLGSEFRYKQFRANVLFDGQFGGKAYSLTHAVLSEEGKLTKTLPGRYNGILGAGVQQNADGTFRPNDIITNNIQAFYNEHYNRDNVEANVFNTDFIKLREVRLDYTFAKTLASQLKLQRATIGVYGRDLFVFSKWPSYDPEFGTLGNGDITAGFEVGQFPSTRTIGLNLTVEF